jgi:transposase
MLLIGIDWADDHHDVCLEDPSGGLLSEFRIGHDADGFALLHGKLSEHCSEPSDILVALETAHGLLVHELLRHGYQVYVINPKAVDRYKDRHRSSGTKDDRLDARALSGLLRTDRHLHRRFWLPPEQYQELDGLCQDLRKLIDDTTRVSNQLTDCLKQFYPQVIGMFNDLASAIAIAFLREYPDPARLKATSRGDFDLFFKKQRYTWPDRVQELYDKAQAPALVSGLVALNRGRMRLPCFLDQLETLRSHRVRYEKAIKQLLEQMPETDTISSLPGAGKRLAPEIVAALGPNVANAPQRFASAKELTNLSGSTPITKQSGRSKTVHARHACRKGLRRTFYEHAEKSIHLCPWASAYYRHHKEQMHAHATIIRNLAVKWIKIIYRLWKTGTQYDEQYHISQLKLRGVVWACGL